jgi:hypothetical protein
MPGGRAHTGLCLLVTLGLDPAVRLDVPVKICIVNDGRRIVREGIRGEGRLVSRSGQFEARVWELIDAG